jgi:2'-hydroxyisoflavone reductase
MIKIKRRNLLVGMGLAGVSAAMLPGLSVAQGKKHLKILVLGWTGFIGPHIVRVALARGHEVTLFNRGEVFCFKQ